ncbi:MAG TPA: transcription antitermination factor NusB [bacterium]|nr:transcription antitermination factor NusB [bacterium]
MRRKARAAALQVLFQMDVGKLSLEDALTSVAAPDWVPDDLTWVETLCRGTRGHLGEIDPVIAQCAERWTLERMAAVDRNILRLAIFELRYTDTPIRVVINEAVELAKRFSTEESGRFVNGLLGKIVRSTTPPLVGHAADV